MGQLNRKKFLGLLTGGALGASSASAVSTGETSAPRTTPQLKVRAPSGIRPADATTARPDANS